MSRLAIRSNSFEDFKRDLKKWLQDNPEKTRLDGKDQGPNREIYAEFTLHEIDSLSGSVCFHGDTKTDQLKRVIGLDIEDFLIMPPQKGKRSWRFHFKSDYNPQNDRARNGFFAYIKKAA